MSRRRLETAANRARRRAARLLPVSAILLLAFATPALAQDAKSSPPRAEGGSQWSVFYGYGFNQEINRSAAEIDIASAGFRWSFLWPEKLTGLLHGNPAFAIEIVPLMTFFENGATTWAPGFNLLYEHHFAADGRVLPVWKIGAGFLYANRELPTGETRHNFTLLTALGVDIMVNQSHALFVGYRFHHVSNANTGNVNPGINAHTVVLGLSFYR